MGVFIFIKSLREKIENEKRLKWQKRIFCRLYCTYKGGWVWGKNGSRNEKKKNYKRVQNDKKEENKLYVLFYVIFLLA